MPPGVTSSGRIGLPPRNSTGSSSSSGGTTTTTRSAGYSFSGQPGSSTASKGTHIPARVACCSAAVGSRAEIRAPGRAFTSVTGSTVATIDPTPLRRVIRPSSASMASARCAVSLDTEYLRASCGSLGTCSPGPSCPLRISSRNSCASWADSGHTDAGSTFMRGAYRNPLPTRPMQVQVLSVSQCSSHRGRIAGLSGETSDPSVSYALRFEETTSCRRHRPVLLHWWPRPGWGTACAGRGTQLLAGVTPGRGCAIASRNCDLRWLTLAQGSSYVL